MEVLGGTKVPEAPLDPPLIAHIYLSTVART